MAVRVRIKVEVINTGKEVETNALVNTGFETEKPQLLIPLKMAEELGLWPPPHGTPMIEMETAGGPVKNYLISNAIQVYLITKDRIIGPVVCDAILSHIEEEVLINDKLGEELKITILRMGEGIWRFYDDPEGITRKSTSPQYWI